MNSPTTLDIAIHFSDGTTAQYKQSGRDLIARTMEAIHPDRVFRHPELIIADADALSVVGTAWIARIEAFANECPAWSFPLHATDVIEIPEDVFKRWHRPERTSTGLCFTDEDRLKLVQIDLVDREQLFWELHFPARRRLLPIDISLSLHHLLDRRCLFARKLGGGFDLVNPANVTNFTVFDSQAELPTQVEATRSGLGGNRLAHSIPF